MNASPLYSVLLTTATTGTSQAHNVLPYVNLTVYLIGTGTITDGTLIVEEATYPDFGSTGATWSAVTSNAPLDCTNVSGGAQMAYQLPIGCYHYIRVRIGTAIAGGGSLSVILVAN